ncbi:MAG: DUF2975 domain-containing protein [Lachnospiraceae bacterium]|nr:DUF2975 domain-containing protein [Lachnospiraceae bacterium]
MKENAISKINKMGRIGTILTTIAKVFTIIGLIVTFVGTIASAFIPKDFFTASADSNLLVNISLASLGSTLTDEEVTQANQEIIKILEEEELMADNSKYGINTMDISNDNISLNFTGKLADFSLHNILWVMLFASLYLAMTLVTLFFIGFLCRAFQNCESPFEENVIKKIKALAYSLIPWAILSTTNDVVADNFFTNSFHLNGIGVDLNMVMTILIILALAYIFQYGAVLQQESDETL